MCVKRKRRAHRCGQSRQAEATRSALSLCSLANNIPEVIRNKKKGLSGVIRNWMRNEGFEPPTAGSGIQRSTTELIPLKGRSAKGQSPDELRGHVATISRTSGYKLRPLSRLLPQVHLTGVKPWVCVESGGSKSTC
jgi:hypothetical protein